MGYNRPIDKVVSSLEPDIAPILHYHHHLESFWWSKPAAVMSKDNTAADWDLIMCIRACHQVYFGDRITDSGYPRSRIDNFESWTFLGILAIRQPWCPGTKLSYFCYLILNSVIIRRYSLKRNHHPILYSNSRQRDMKSSPQIAHDT